VDYDPAMVAEANRRAEAAGVAAWTRHEHAAAHALPFADGYFDAVRSERMLQHLVEPEPAIAELVRVTRPGGRVVVVDSDWGSLSLQMGDAALERRLVAVQQFERNHNSFSGRRLPGQLAAAGLHNLHVEVFPLMTTRLPVAQRILGFEGMEQLALDLGRVTPDELARWRAGLAAADADGTFYFCLNLVLVAGMAGAAHSGPL
jgi:SAM-dependent methyltransferase